jgi:hypothetical protein
MLRLNIGSPPPAAPPPGAPGFNFLGAVEPAPGGSSIPVGWQPAEGDPFAPKAPAFQTGPVQTPAGTGQGGSGGAWAPVDFDPFATNATPKDAGASGTPGIVDASAPDDPNAGGMGGTGGPAPYHYSQGTEKSVGWTESPAWMPGVLSKIFPGTATQSDFGETEVPVEEPGPAMGSRTGTPKTQPAPGTAAIGAAGELLRAYLHLPKPQEAWADRAAQMIDAAPPGSYTNVPDLNVTGPANVQRVKERVMNTPVERAGLWGDGRDVGNAPKGSLGYDTHGDVYGGQATNWSLLKASLVPLRTQEQLEKRIAILAADLGVPPNRFFTKDGQIKYIDLAGKAHAVAPSSQGGTWKAPIDKISRIGGEVASEAGQGIPMAAGMAGGMMGGGRGEAYALAAMLAAAGMSAVADTIRQAAGNQIAINAGYRTLTKDGKEEPPPTPLADIDWWNVAGQAAQNMGFEAFARALPLILGNMAPKMFGQNPYRLSGTEAQDLARVLHADAEQGGSILKRAINTSKLGLPLTPRDLLQITRDMLGSSADISNMRSRLFESLSQHENTLATLGGKRGAEASNLMKNFYRYRSRVQFPEAVMKLVRMIHPEEMGPAVAYKEFKAAAGRVQNHLENKRTAAGLKQGWDVLFKSPTAMANPVPVIRQIDAALPNSAGPIRKALQEVRGELIERSAYTHGGKTAMRDEAVTSYQRLHQVRLGLERKIDKLKHGPASAESAEVQKELEKVHDLLRHQLNNHPLYALGDRAYHEASIPLTDARKGLEVLQRDALHQERQGGVLADAGPTTIKAARELFIEAGEQSAWDAHTRAYLETHLRTSGGAGGMNTAAQGGAHQPGLNFANEVASQPHLHSGLMEMVTNPEQRELLDSLIDAGYAIDQANRGVNDAALHAVKPNPRRLNPNGTNIFGKLAGALTPVQAIISRSRAIQEFLDTRGAHRQAFDLTQGSRKAYAEMADTTVPLAGPRAERFERGLYAAAPVFAEQTDWIPRPSPQWFLKQGLPLLTPPPERSATAPDLKIPQSALSRLLGPAP